MPREIKVEGYDEALLLQLAPPKFYDVSIDVYHPEAGKVLSIGTIGEVDTLISMQPGPWEANSVCRAVIGRRRPPSGSRRGDGSADGSLGIGEHGGGGGRPDGRQVLESPQVILGPALRRSRNGDFRHGTAHVARELWLDRLEGRRASRPGRVQLGRDDGG
ncbi:hypothetical protein AB5I41_25280 [Sphingomonas sp. MMS24-JH45]